MATRYNKTLADYLVIAVSPALIMTLVGSLVFFLLQLFYQGNYLWRLHYILSLFIFAAVLIGRISIEEGRERAALFALPLAAATLIAIFRFVQFQGSLLGPFNFVINFGLIALIWWCADRLTWDCTMIDEAESSSGEGLLDAAGLGERPVGVGWAKRASASAGPPVREAESSHGGPALAGLAGPTLRTSRGKPHAPGVWVVYFSLAALPLFGLGQLAIPVAQESRRRYAFCLLAIYVASGLGLLLTTSFLGLRRYLRQRRLPMPMVMAGSWIAVGCALIFIVMGLALLLPRPSAEFAVSQLPRVMGSPDQKPSPQGMGNDGVKSDEPGRPVPKEKGRPAAGRDGAKHPDGQPSEKPGEGESKSGKSDGKEQDSGKQQKNKAGNDKAAGPRTTGGDGGKQPSGDSKERPAHDGSKQKPPARQTPGDKEKPKTGPQSEKPPDAGPARQPPGQRAPQFNPPPIDFSSMLGWLLPLIQIVFYVVLAGLAIFWAWSHRAGILAAIRDLLIGIRSFWEHLWGGRRKTAQAADAADRAPPRPRPFAEFADPFATGMAAQISSEQLVRYLFEAFEAWGRDQGFPRQPDQTPLEFARSAAQHKPLRHLAAVLADLYCEAAYAPGRLRITDPQPLQELWRALRARPLVESHDK